MWISTAAPGKLLFQLRQPRIETLAGMLVADLAGGVQPFRQVVDQTVDPADHRLKLLASEEVGNDDKTVFLELPDLGFGKSHGRILFGWLRLCS